MPELPEWVGKFLNRRTEVEQVLRAPLVAQRKGLPMPEALSPEATNDLANLLSVPEEFAQSSTPTSAEQELAAVRAELKACGHDYDGAPLDRLVDRAIDRERSRIEEIRKGVAALGARAQLVYSLPDFLLKEIAQDATADRGEF